MLASLIPFTKLDIFIGLLAATVSSFASGSFLPSLLLGLVITFSFSSLRDYFSYHRVKTTLSIFYDSIKTKIFGKPDTTLPNYRAMPNNNPYDRKIKLDQKQNTSLKLYSTFSSSTARSKNMENKSYPL